METTNIAPNPIAQTIGKLLAGGFLYEFEDGKGAENLQKGISKARKFLGEEGLKKLLEATEEQHCALVYACVDKAVLNKITPTTKELISKLDMPLRIFVETLLFRLTGQNIIDDKNSERWAPALYKIKKMSKKYLELSPSNVTGEELATVLKEVAISLITAIREHISKQL